MRGPRVRPAFEEHAIDEARRVLKELDIARSDQIDLDRIAAAHRAEVVCQDIDGATARVMRIGELAKITISSRIIELGARRFPLAHEIGHIRLGHEIPDGSAGEIVERICNPLVACRREPERAASVFATEVVMPELLVRPFCTSEHATLAPARAIACEFTTSLLASAMRFVELTYHRCAIAYSRLGRVCWIKPSATFPDWIPKGTRLDPSSAAFDYHRGGTIQTAPRTIAAGAWLPRVRIDGPNVDIVEHSAAIPELGTVFTMLWIPDRDVRHLDLAA